MQDRDIVTPKTNSNLYAFYQMVLFPVTPKYLNHPIFYTICCLSYLCNG